VSTIKEVQAAEQRVKKAMQALRTANALDPNHISDELKKATDEYARLVRELKPADPPKKQNRRRRPFQHRP
jgi:hypothetical protein